MARTSRSVGIVGCLAVTVAVSVAGRPASAAPPDPAGVAAPAAAARVLVGACGVAAGGTGVVGLARVPWTWTAVVELRGSRTLEEQYAISAPTIRTDPMPRLSVTSLPGTPVFTLTVRRSSSGMPTYLGVLRFTDGAGVEGIARVVGTWSDRTARFWGGWMAAGGQRGTVVIDLVRGAC